MCLKAKKRLPPYIIALIIPVMTSLSLYSQNFTIKTYTTADGLAHNNVRTLTRDSTGFLWIGTWDGLSRFDGHEFKNYFHIPRDSTSLPYFSVSNLKVDCDNNLWVHTDFGQVVRYNRATDNFTVLRNIEGIPIEHAVGISIDNEGHLWISNRNEVIKWIDRIRESKVLKLFKTDGEPFYLDYQCNNITILKDSSIWITGTRILEFRKTGNSQYTFEKEYPLIRLPSLRRIEYDYKTWFSLYNSDSDNKWIFSNTGLYKLDKERGVFKSYEGEIPADEFRGRKYFYWGWMNNGIYIFDTKNRRLTHIPEKDTKVPVDLSISEEQLLWFSSYTQSGVPRGLSRLIMTSGFFDNNIMSDPDSAAPAIYSVVLDRYNNIWTGIRGYDHIVQTGPDKKPVNLYQFDPGSKPASTYIRSMIPVAEGIWIGYYTKLLQFYDYKTSKFTNHFPDAHSLRAILVNKEGNIYIGTEKLAIYYPVTGKTETLLQLPSESMIFKLYQAPDGILWAGLSSNRILKYNPENGENTIIKLAAEQSNVEDLTPGENGELWLALLGEGVCRYKPSDGTFMFYTTSSGLSNNTTYSLLKDHSGNIWVSTNNGISRINPETGQIRIFGITDGLAISEFNSGAKFIADDGKFFFGGMGGYTSFYPDSIEIKENGGGNPKLILTHLEVSGEVRHLPVELNGTDTIIFSKGENNFHLTFSSTDFINSDKTLYRYKLSGVNKSWVETSSRNRNINYLNLKPGWHNLQIEAADMNGNWRASKNMVIRVTPFIYQTKLFRVSAPLLIVAIIISLIFFYIRNLRQKERQKQYELMLQSLRGQMNPHFIFNSLNSINYFISNNDRLSANRYIADFSRLIRSILSNMGNKYIKLENELSSIEDYLRIEHLRFADKFDYEIRTEDIADMNDVEVCPGIVQPFVENAIWHGVRALENRKGFIRIRFIHSENGGIKCIIEDDGVGRVVSVRRQENKENHKSRGIDIVKEQLQLSGRLHRNNYKVEITDLYSDRVETGTKVEVDIPVRTGK